MISNLNIYKKTNLLITAIFFALFLNSCGIWDPADARKTPTNADERVKKNLEEGKGISIGGLMGGKGGTEYQFASSNPMWRASLEILDFLPLSNVDYSGGIITTDWYNDGANSDESIKITIRFLSNEIRADGLKITVHQKICDESKNCKISKITTDLANQLKLNILKKAVKIEKKLTKKKVSAFRKQFPKRQTPKKDK